MPPCDPARRANRRRMPERFLARSATCVSRRDLYISSAEAIVLVYSVLSESSLQELTKTKELVDEIKFVPALPLVCVCVCVRSYVCTLQTYACLTLLSVTMLLLVGRHIVRCLRWLATRLIWSTSVSCRPRLEGHLPSSGAAHSCEWRARSSACRLLAGADCACVARVRLCSETSAKSDVNVTPMFMQLITRVVHEIPRPRSRKSCILQ